MIGWWENAILREFWENNRENVRVRERGINLIDKIIEYYLSIKKRGKETESERE